MEEQLNILAGRYEQLTAQLDDPATYADPALSARLTKERRDLEPVMEALHRRETIRRDLAEARALLGDPELGELARKEAFDAEAALAETQETLRALLLPKDPRDGRSVVLELRAGTGGEEAALFAADLFRMYSLYAARRGWRVAVASVSETELGGFKELVCTVEGEDVWSRMKYEAGSHCVKRVPVTESSGRIQTSTATVAVLPEAEDAELVLDPKDVKIDTFRSSGAGGQKVNKTESAVRVTHLPTGTVVECQDERSQTQNRERALTILRSRLLEAEQEKLGAAEAAARRSQVGTGRRSEKIRTYFFLRGQITDQRLSGEDKSYSLDAALRGDLDGLIDRIAAAEQARRLKETL